MINSQGQLVADPSQQAGFVNPNINLYAKGTDQQDPVATTTWGAQGTTPITKYSSTTSQPAQQLQAGVPSSLRIRMKDGTEQTIPITAADLQGHASPQFQAAIAAGGDVINPSTGQSLVRGGNAYQGSLFQDASGHYVPLQVALGYQYFPGQEQAYNNLAAANDPASLGKQGWQLSEPQLSPEAAALAPYYKDPGSSLGPTYNPKPGAGGGTTGGGTLSSLLSSGSSGAPQISDINLPGTPGSTEPMPKISGTFDPNFISPTGAGTGTYEQAAANYVNNLGGYYGGNWGQMRAAQFPTQAQMSSGQGISSNMRPSQGIGGYSPIGMPAMSGTMMPSSTVGQSATMPDMPQMRGTMMPEMGRGQVAPSGGLDQWGNKSVTDADVPSAAQGVFMRAGGTGAGQQPGDTPWTPQVTATGYNAQTPGSFGALNFLLSGQGFDPATLARMNTTASDAVSREQQGQLSSAKIAAQNAGMADSGASLAQQDVINRQAGDARTQAANQIAIQNAMQGINNLTTGAGMELGRETTAAGMQNQAGQFNAQMANQAALQNAMNEFQAMTQNVNNQQQANATNTQNTFAQNQMRAQAQGGAANQIIQNTMAGQLSRNANADFTNTQNLIGQQLNQAQLNRQRQMFNAGMGENRYSQALGGLLSLSGSANPYAYYGSSASSGSNYNPNLTIPNAVSGISTSLNAGNPNNPYNTGSKS